ncbi:MAG: (d)CMP kinase [Bryobacteraceae bacterium]
MKKRLVVAIDGPAGAGKSTLARRIADKLGILYIDSGAMYRAIGLWALRAGIDLEDAQRLEQLAQHAQIELKPEGGRVFLNGEDVTEAIRTPEVSEAASKASALPGVRRAMVEQQRRMARETSVVMEGRDIGTVVFPHADVKIFLDADPAERARRRMEEAKARGAHPDPLQMQREIDERDARDRSRSTAPLLQAPDAVYLDSTGLKISEVEDKVLRIIRERTSNGKEHQA